ncbi:hypothetical protein GA0115234_108849 [Streptomyces sp. DvalAA-43]|nr:hypothetical protein GA0115234_108849 [Streptomyces sp. DvalAA-43]
MAGAVEGTTFTRERRFFPRTRIRRDLTTSLYRIPTADKVRWAPGVRNCA